MVKIDIKEFQDKQRFLNLCQQVTHDINEFMEEKYFKKADNVIPASVIVASLSEILSAHLASFMYTFEATKYLPENLKAIELRTTQFLEALQEKKDGLD